MAVESAADLAGMFDTDEFALSSTYTPSGGSPSTVAVIVDKDVEFIGVGDSDMADRRTVLTVQNVQVASPGAGDTFLIGAVTYTVDRIIDDDGAVTQVSAK